MSGHNPLREDKTCLNCRHVVEKRYCPNCGQENSSSRKTFHQLFVHFFEDLTHYENSFWKTIRHLLFKPGRLTKEYLSGKRLSYLAPIRLYIFISFVTFFTMSVLPEGPVEIKSTPDKEVKNEVKPEDFTKDELTLVGETGDTVRIKNTWSKYQNKRGFGGYQSVKEFDSVQKFGPASERLTGIRYKIERKLAEIREKSDDEDFEERWSDAFMSNIPKALFLYMPLFAFWLWIFHGKKRWYYFDHGIFTLHYFSFLLLTLCVMSIVSTAVSYLDIGLLTGFVVFLWFFLFGWWFFYFFRSHSNFYGEHKAISRLKGLALYFINMVLICIFTIGLLVYTLLYVH